MLPAGTSSPIPANSSFEHDVASATPPVNQTLDDGLRCPASESSRPSSSGTGLRRKESRVQRIGTILERGLARAQSSKSDPMTQSTTTRMEPLLGHATRQTQYHDDTSGDDGPEMALPGRSGRDGKRRDSGSQPNYQLIHTQQQHQSSRAGTDGSVMHRRSVARNHIRRRDNSRTAVCQGDGEVNGHQNQGEAGKGGLLAKVKAGLALFGSVELDNKGSVARDHLALERTFLAWLRTSVSFASIGIAVTQLFRLNTSINSGRSRDGDSGRDLAELRRLGKPLGAAFLVISILILFLGYGRYVRGQRWVMAGRFPASRGTVILVTILTFCVMVASLSIVIIFSPGGW